MITIQFTGNTIEEVMVQIQKAAIGNATKQMAEAIKEDLETEPEVEAPKTEAPKARKKKEPEAPKKVLTMEKDIMPSFQKFLADETAKSGADYAKQRIREIVKKLGADTVRALKPEHFEAALAEIGA